MKSKAHHPTFARYSDHKISMFSIIHNFLYFIIFATEYFEIWDNRNVRGTHTHVPVEDEPYGINHSEVIGYSYNFHPLKTPIPRTLVQASYSQRFLVPLLDVGNCVSTVTTANLHWSSFTQDDLRAKLAHLSCSLQVPNASRHIGQASDAT